MPQIDEAYCQNLLKNEQEKYKKECRESLYREDAHTSNEAYTKILRLSGIRERSVKELRDHLQKENFREGEIEDALERAQTCGLVDDFRFGEMLIVSRKSAGKGKQGIEYELEKNGIDANAIPGWPEEYFLNEESEIEEAITFLTKKPPRAKNKREAAYRKLISRGYSSTVASRAVRSWFENLV